MLRFMERSTIHYLKQKGWTNVETSRIHGPPSKYGGTSLARGGGEETQDTQP
jgi:hypothetical protein